MRPAAPLFEEAGVRVIRVGLHAQEDVERRRVAGPYHPAFRELVESRRFLARLLRSWKSSLPAPMRCGCAPGSCPWPRGRRRCNLEALARRGYAVRFVPDASLAPGRFGVGPQETRNEKGKQAQ